MRRAASITLCALILCLHTAAHGRVLAQQNATQVETPQEGPVEFVTFLPGDLLSFPPASEVEAMESCIPQGLDCPEDEICSPVGEEEGVCATIPVGGVALPSSATSFPMPVVHFPLTGGSLTPWPSNGLSGVSHEVTWKKDKRFGLVPHCDEDASSMIALQGVPFGHDGPFSVNLWIQKDKDTNLNGSAFQYIFSVTSLANAKLARSRWEFSNQVHIFVPERLNSAPPLVRVIVQDSDDGGRIYYMDSDGVVERITIPNGTNATHADLDDGKWHMITVTTISEEKKGFRIFVDGKLTAETPDDGESHGGHPIFADGDFFLCGRSDHNPERHFDGSVTQLSIYDVSLTEKQVQELYHTVASDGLIASQTLDFARNEDTEKDRIANFKLSPQKVAFAGVGDLNEFRHDDYAATSTMCTEAQGCEVGEICGALHPSSIDKLNSKGETVGNDTGLCAKPPTGGLPDQQILAATPVPFAFFPLTGGDTRSWPVPKYSGLPLRLDLHDDEVFGSVFRCTQRNLSMLVMDEVPFGVNGTFALNIWFRPTNLTGPLFQYLISQTDERNSRGTSWGEQLSVYLGETLHVAFGLVRTIFKDEDDTLDEVYVDSDGLIGVTQPTERLPTIEIKDGNWHMYTFTTNAPGEKGYSFYLDGTHVAKVDEESLNAPVKMLPGGDPFTPVGAMLLCGRKDGHPERHFEGDIAHLSLFDTHLSGEAIKGLFDSISEDKLTMSRDANVAPEYPEVTHPYFGLPMDFAAPEGEPTTVQVIDEPIGQAPGDPHMSTHPGGPPPTLVPRPIGVTGLSPAPGLQAPALSSTSSISENPTAPSQAPPPRATGAPSSNTLGVQPVVPGTQNPRQQPLSVPSSTEVPVTPLVPAPAENLPETQTDEPPSIAETPVAAPPQTLSPETPPPELLPEPTPQSGGSLGTTELAEPATTTPAATTPAATTPAATTPAEAPRSQNYVSDLD